MACAALLETGSFSEGISHISQKTFPVDNRMFCADSPESNERLLPRTVTGMRGSWQKIGIARSES
jgi:hypothetical protein